jgi:cytochrome oxidase assembly protein ShyY1
VKSDWFWLLVFVLFIAGTYIAEALSKQRKRMKDIEERLDRIETKVSPPPKPLPYSDAVKRQAERTRQFLEERERRQSSDDSATHK